MSSIETSYFKKKYPKSKNNRQCLTDCYSANKWILHPVAVQFTSLDKPFCPVMEYEEEDPKTGKKRPRLTDECLMATADNIPTKELQMNIITPKFDFECQHFLKIYYGIFSFDQTLEYIRDHPELSTKTRNRILNCSWVAFGKGMINIDDRIIDYYIKYFSGIFLNKFYGRLKKYVKIEGEKISFGKTTSDGDDDIKLKFLKEKLNTFQTVKKFLKSFLKKNEKWDENKDYNKIINKEFIDYLEKKILETLK